MKPDAKEEVRVGSRKPRWVDGGRGGSANEIRRPEATDGDRSDGWKVSSPKVMLGERRLLFCPAL